MTDECAVDTNVGIVANDRPGENTRSLDCVLACQRLLRDVMAFGLLITDQQWQIINEYRDHLRSSGQPGVGDAFLKWVLVNRANPARCRQVDIDAVEVPRPLADFDPADHKFLRVAAAAPGAHIAQACDSLWWKRRADFAAAGIAVRFLCPEEIAALSDRKHGPDDDN